MSEQIKHEESIFLAALDRPTPAERLAYLEGACGSDEALLSRVRELLASHEESLGPLDVPAVAEAPTAAVPSVKEKPSTTIGPYKLREKLGEGGFGVVYVAEQLKPVRRKVALKVIKPGMDSQEVVARFEAERQALALMDHANIARVLDAGTTEEGRPYFVMELVLGIRITEFCDKNNLSTTDRLKLFLDVCRAVHHAHQKGIIHRDLKPSNVMVTLRDGQPVPKVIDFGVSKALNQHLTEKTIYTAYGQIIGTPQYMSPEQAEMSELGVDTRSDIYSLGVLLYELLTGTTPVEPGRLLSSGYAEMMRIIREEDPVRPSTKVSTMGEKATAIAKSRRTDPRELGRTLRNELDWIVMKALDKDRERRYESANQFISDVSRFLSDEAVLACPPSFGYRTRKLFRRHRTMVITATVLTLALCLGLVGTSIGMFRAIAAEADAKEARKIADQKTQTVLMKNEELERARAKAEAAERISNHRAETINRNLYFSQMNLAGFAAGIRGGARRLDELTNQWLPSSDDPDLRGWEWYYLRSKLHQDLQTLTSHTRPVTSVAWSPDGVHAASASADGTIKVWNAESGTLVDTFKGHTKEVTEISWSPDGTKLASGSDDCTVRVWSIKSTDEPLILRAHSLPVAAVAWSFDGTCVASGSLDKTIKFWDASTWQQMGRPLEGSSPVFSLAWSPNGEQIASGGGGPGGQPAAISIWDVETGKLKHKIDAHKRAVRSLDWHPDGTRLLSAGADLHINISDVATGTEVSRFPGHGHVYAAAWSPDGKRFAVGSERRAITVWDANTETHWESPTEDELLTIQGHTESVLSVSWSPDGKRLASAGIDNCVKIWNFAELLSNKLEDSGQSDADYAGHVRTISWSHHGLLVLGEQENKFKIWDFDSGNLRQSFVEPVDIQSIGGVLTRQAAIAPDATHVAAPLADGMIGLWDIQTGSQVTTWNPHGPVAMMSWAPDSERLAIASFDDNGVVRIFDRRNKQQNLMLKGHTDSVRSITWSPDGSRLATGANDKDATIRVWDARTGEQLQLLTGHQNRISFLAWSPDGKQLASGGEDNMIFLWDPETGVQRRSLSGHINNILALAWSPDSSRLASAGRGGGSLRVWDPESGQETLTKEIPFGGRGDGWLAWSPSGQRLAVISKHQVRILDARKGYAEEQEQFRQEE